MQEENKLKYKKKTFLPIHRDILQHIMYKRMLCDALLSQIKCLAICKSKIENMTQNLKLITPAILKHLTSISYFVLTNTFALLDIHQFIVYRYCTEHILLPLFSKWTSVIDND